VFVSFVGVFRACAWVLGADVVQKAWAKYFRRGVSSNNVRMFFRQGFVPRLFVDDKLHSYSWDVLAGWVLEHTCRVLIAESNINSQKWARESFYRSPLQTLRDSLLIWRSAVHPTSTPHLVFCFHLKSVISVKSTVTCQPGSPRRPVLFILINFLGFQIKKGSKLPKKYTSL